MEPVLKYKYKLQSYETGEVIEVINSISWEEIGFTYDQVDLEEYNKSELDDKLELLEIIQEEDKTYKLLNADKEYELLEAEFFVQKPRVVLISFEGKHSIVNSHKYTNQCVSEVLKEVKQRLREKSLLGYDNNTYQEQSLQYSTMVTWL